MKKKIFEILLIILGISVFGVDFDTLNKYIWLEKIPYTRGAYTHFYKITELPENYFFYKMKFYSKKVDSTLFFIFLYNPEKKRFSEIDRMSYFWSKIPLFGFDYKGFEVYAKTEGNPEEIEGKYFCETEEIYEFEIRKVEEQKFLYAVALDYEQSGLHLLYLEDDVLKSDGTFGFHEEENLEKLFEVDRPESFYNNRNILSAYTDDDFSISILNNEDFYIELELQSNKRRIPLMPEALYKCADYHIRSGAEIYDENLNLIRKQQKSEEIVKVLQKKYEWVERNGLYNLLEEIQFGDGTSGWVYSDSLNMF